MTTLTTGQLHDLYAKLSEFERLDGLKLAGETWVKLAINANALRPFAEAYERARTRVLGDLYRDNRELPAEKRRGEAEVQADFVAQDEALRAAEVDVPIKTILKADLRLDDNPKIAAALSRLIPIVDGLA